VNERVRQPQRALGPRLHRAGNIDQQQYATLALFARATQKADDLAVASHHMAEGTARIGGAAFAVRHPSRTAARQRMRQAPGERAQRRGLIIDKAAREQTLGDRRVRP
jgi:hypothetical protein